MTANRNRGQLLIIGLIILLLIILAFFGIELLLTGFRNNPPIQGEPKKDQATGLYTVYVLIGGHRDLTILHRNLRANVHLDYVSFYFESPPDLPSGSSILDFSKSIHVTVTVEGEGFLAQPKISTFDARVSIGARWGRAVIYTLPSGTYNIEAQGVDQDGFPSSASAKFILP